MTGDRPLVVVADPLGAQGLDLLREHLQVTVADDEQALAQALPHAHALVVRSRTNVTADVLQAGGNLRLVARAGIGVDNIDVAAATRRNILVINAPLGNVRSTAEHTVALLFALARRIVSADLAVRNGTWKSGYEGMQVAGKALGLVGAGKVGKTVASMAQALGMEVSAYDPYLPAAAMQDLNIQPLTLDAVLRQSDIVSLHVPLSDDTRNLIDAAALARMKSGSYLINCARGGLLDEDALAEALTRGHLAGAALDVYAHEPLRNSGLLHAPNLVLSPHVAASTREAQKQVSIDIAAGVLDFFAGRPASFPINSAVLHKV